LQPDQILHARDRVAQRAVRGVHQRGLLQRACLVVRRRLLLEVRMPLSRQLVEPLLQRGSIDRQRARQPKYVEVVQATPFTSVRKRLDAPGGASPPSIVPS